MNERVASALRAVKAHNRWKMCLEFRQTNINPSLSILKILREHANKKPYHAQRRIPFLRKGVCVTIPVAILMSAVAFTVSIFPNVY